MQTQATLHPDGGQQVVLGVAEFAFGNGSTRIGEIATVAAGVLVAVGVVVGIRSIPDIQRYLKIREM